MRRSRGMVQIYLIVALAAVLGMVGAYLWGRTDGKALERAQALKRDNEALVKANAEIIRLGKEVRDKEAAHAARVSEIDSQHQKEKADAQAQRDRDAAAIRTGALRLRDLGARCARAVSGPVPAADAGAGGTENRGGAELSDAAAGFLLGEAARADDLARRHKRTVEALIACETLANGGAAR